MISLSKRLQTIADLITKDDIVLDVGCDHALLDIYLSNKYKKKYYASDIKESALIIAKENIKKYRAYDVELLLGNGLERINNKVNTVVISGMGAFTINFILRSINKYNNINKLIIQSNTEVETTRKYILKKGFYIEEEHIVFDKNIYYVVSVYKRGKRKYSNVEKELGIMVDKDLSKYLDMEILKNKSLLKIVPKKHIKKRYEIKKRIRLLIKKRSSIK